eukprot:g3504.t1
MGANMARHLKDSGYEIGAVYDVNEKLAEEIAVELGAERAGELAGVTAGADVILTVVTDDAAMRAIFTGDGLLKEAEGKVFLNCATLTPEVQVAVDQACQKAGAKALEACMASSITQAREGTLYLMIGGEEEVYEENRELLEVLSTALRYVGPTGSAAKVKALVNMVMNINTAGLAEGLGLGDALGLDLGMLREVFSQTGANSRVLETDAEDMVMRDHDCYFSAAHAAKDSGIANGLAKEAGVAVPLSEATEGQYRKLIDAGKGDLDKSGVAELTFKGRGA